GDEPQFDPGVLTEGDKTYLYTGFCGRGDKSRTGSKCCTLGPDMLTIIEEPVLVVPGCEYCEGTGFEGHAFFEASSIRKHGDTYYFIYSSTPMHELCYATSKNPRGGFKYGGVIVSNADVGIDTYKPADLPVCYGANNHGSIVEINGQWYIFYHRQTNGTWYSRQGCAERIQILEDGSIPQVEITSCGLNGGPLKAEGTYDTYIACHLFTDKPSVYLGGDEFPKIMKDGGDGDEVPGYVGNMKNNATMGIKYFDYQGVKGLRVFMRGYMGGTVEIRNEFQGPVLGEFTVQNENFDFPFEAKVDFPDGKHCLYLTYKGSGNPSITKIEFLK
ncbi:MAG: family 43 glycosylhydrolase, partial [Lachnospiraceae bacterium]|nr:family 43 glycosylhydrolase [Lachnospiraceae bacterium]